MDAGRLRFAVGDAVVYGAHGIGRIVARRQSVVAGSERDCIVLDLSAGLRVTLPLEVAAARLRNVADQVEVATVQRTLAAESGGRDGSWTRRIKESRAKLASGRATDLAELVRGTDVAAAAPNRVRSCRPASGASIYRRGSSSRARSPARAVWKRTRPRRGSTLRLRFLLRTEAEWQRRRRVRPLRRRSASRPSRNAEPASRSVSKRHG